MCLASSIPIATAKRPSPTRAGTMQYPTLMRTNYNEWSLLMKVNLEVQRLWHIVESEKDVIEYHEDHLAFADILRVVPPEMLASLTTKHTSQTTWEVIKSRQVDVQWVREANVEPLQK
jgi:hypothetical protein